MRKLLYKQAVDLNRLAMSLATNNYEHELPINRRDSVHKLVTAISKNGIDSISCYPIPQDRGDDDASHYTIDLAQALALVGIQKCIDKNNEGALKAIIYASAFIGMFEVTNSFVNRLNREQDFDQIKSIFDSWSSARGKVAVSRRADQQHKSGWIEHCKQALRSGVQVSTLDDLLQITGYEPNILSITPRTLKAWAKEAGVVFKAGRPKK